MQKIAISSSYRTGQGKGPARQLRAKGKVPAVIYRKGASSLLALDRKEIHRVLQSAGSRHLVTLNFPGEGSKSEGESKLAIMKAVQRDPATDDILHVDFLEVAMNETILFRVPLEVSGVSIGVKAGGILQQSLRELEVRCLPSAIPERIYVDISSLAIGQSIHLKDINLGEGITRVSDANLVVVSVIPPVSEAKLEASLATTPKTAGETKEPEVIGQKEREAKEKEKEAASKTKDAGSKDAGGGKAKAKG